MSVFPKWPNIGTALWETVSPMLQATLKGTNPWSFFAGLTPPCRHYSLASGDYNQKKWAFFLIYKKADFWLLEHQFEQSKTTWRKACQGVLQPAAHHNIQGYTFSLCWAGLPLQVHSDKDHTYFELLLMYSGCAQKTLCTSVQHLYCTYNSKCRDTESVHTEQQVKYMFYRATKARPGVQV